MFFAIANGGAYEFGWRIVGCIGRCYRRCWYSLAGKLETPGRPYSHGSQAGFGLSGRGVKAEGLCSSGDGQTSREAGIQERCGRGGENQNMADTNDHDAVVRSSDQGLDAVVRSTLPREPGGHRDPSGGLTAGDKLARREAQLVNDLLAIDTSLAETRERVARMLAEIKDQK